MEIRKISDGEIGGIKREKEKMLTQTLEWVFHQ